MDLQESLSAERFSKSSAELILGSCHYTLLPLTNSVTRMQQSKESMWQNLCGGWDGSVPVVISNAEVGKSLQGVPALLSCAFPRRTLKEETTLLVSGFWGFW